MTRKRYDVVGLGENSVDLVYRLPELPLPNTKLRIVSREVRPGGQVATMLCTCARLGLKTAYVGTFGDDEEGTLIRETLAAHGVDLTYATTRRARTRHACILVDERRGDRAVLWERDPALALTEEDLPRGIFEDARVVHVDSVDEDASLAAVRRARASGAEVTTDVDNATPGARAIVVAATLPILAADVPRRLTGEADPARALRRLAAERPAGRPLETALTSASARICVTLGEEGAVLLDGDRLYEESGFPVEAVDTTGAGDVFRGAFVFALLRGDDPAAILRFANAAAAISCTREGAIGGIPTLEEIEELLKELR